MCGLYSILLYNHRINPEAGGCAYEDPCGLDNIHSDKLIDGLRSDTVYSVATLTRARFMYENGRATHIDSRWKVKTFYNANSQTIS